MHAQAHPKAQVRCVLRASGTAGAGSYNYSRLRVRLELTECAAKRASRSVALPRPCPGPCPWAGGRPRRAAPEDSEHLARDDAVFSASCMHSPRSRLTVSDQQRVTMVRCPPPRRIGAEGRCTAERAPRTSLRSASRTAQRTVAPMAAARSAQLTRTGHAGHRHTWWNVRKRNRGPARLGSAQLTWHASPMHPLVTAARTWPVSHA